jgi:hypothetical protein
MVFVVFIQNAIDAEDLLIYIAKGFNLFRMCGTPLALFTIYGFIEVSKALKPGLFGL